MSLALVLSGCENSRGLFQRQIAKPSDIILNCPAEPLVLFEGDEVPSLESLTDPITGQIREYYIITDQNDAERFNEAVRRAGAQCRAAVRANCQFYKDNEVRVVCRGQEQD